MESLIDKAPFVAGFVIIFGMFIAHMRFREKNLSQISETCHEVSYAAIQAINESNLRSGANTEVLQEVKRLLIRLNGGR